MKLKHPYHNLNGQCKFTGRIDGEKCVFYGVELECTGHKGDSNGWVRAVRYFKCQPGKCVFVRKDGIQKANVMIFDFEIIARRFYIRTSGAYTEVDKESIFVDSIPMHISLILHIGLSLPYVPLNINRRAPSK